MSPYFEEWLELSNNEYEARRARQESPKDDNDNVSPTNPTEVQHSQFQFNLPTLSTVQQFPAYYHPQPSEELPSHHNQLSEEPQATDNDYNEYETQYYGIGEETAKETAYEENWEMVQQIQDFINDPIPNVEVPIKYTYPDPELCAIFRPLLEEEPQQNLFTNTYSQEIPSLCTPYKYQDNHVTNNEYLSSSPFIQGPTAAVSYQFLNIEDVTAPNVQTVPQLPLPPFSSATIPSLPQLPQYQPPSQLSTPPQIPDTYAGRRNPSARDNYPWECAECNKRFLYNDSGAKHWRMYHSGPVQMIQLYNAPKRPRPGQPRNSYNARAQMRNRVKAAQRAAKANNTTGEK